MNITPLTCQYFTTEQLSQISPDAEEAIQAFFDSDLDVSFGDANLTMVDISVFVDMLENGLEQRGIMWDNDDKPHKGFVEIVEVLKPFENTTYVDLEN